MMITWIVPIVCFFSLTVATPNPGFRTALTANSLAYISKIGLPILEQQLSNVKLPDVSGKASVDVVGTISYTLSNIKLFNLKIATLDVKSSTVGLSVVATEISIDGSTDWKYSNHGWIRISDSGSADLSVSSVSLSISVIIGKDTQGHATLKSTGCTLDIGHLGIKFHGGASWLYNLFDSSIAGSIKSSMKKQLCSAATQAIDDDGNKALETLPMIVKIDKTAEVTYALLSNPIFNANFIETQHKGEFLNIDKPVDAQLSPVQLPSITSYDRMMYIWLTDYVVNTAGIVYQNAGILQYTITPDMVPNSFPIHLNTSSFKLLIPNLYKDFPNMNMELFINSTIPPVLKVIPNSANFTITGTIDVNVIQPSKTKVNAFTIGLTVYTTARVWVHPNGTDQVISANCTLLKFDLSLLSSKIGNFPINILQYSANLLVNAFILPLVNRYANAGLMIPIIDGLSFVSPQLTLGQGFILIDTDVSYKPSYMRRN